MIFVTLVYMKNTNPIITCTWLIAICLFPGCNQEPADHTLGKIKLKSNKRIEVNYEPGVTLTINTNTSLDGISNYFYDTNSDQLVVKNGYTIMAFDMKGGQLVERWDIPTEGPNSIKKLTGLDGVVSFNGKYYIAKHWGKEVYAWSDGTAEKLYKKPDLSYGNSFLTTTLSYPIIVDEEWIIPLYVETDYQYSETGAFAVFHFGTQHFR